MSELKRYKPSVELAEDGPVATMWESSLSDAADYPDYVLATEADALLASQREEIRRLGDALRKAEATIAAREAECRVKAVALEHLTATNERLAKALSAFAPRQREYIEVLLQLGEWRITSVTLTRPGESETLNAPAQPDEKGA